MLPRTKQGRQLANETREGTCTASSDAMDNYNVTGGSHNPSGDLAPQHRDKQTTQPLPSPERIRGSTTGNTAELGVLFRKVVAQRKFNFRGARARVPSGLNVTAWRHYLEDYHDKGVCEFIEFGWPVNYTGGTPLVSTENNHPSATRYPEDIAHYIRTELGHNALAGPFKAPSVPYLHTSPLMTKPKKDSEHRRVIMDLSWPRGAAVNDGIQGQAYVEGTATIRLPTVDYLVARLLELGEGAFMYKTDLARGYRQLRVDPGDWPLLGFRHNGDYYMDICPPFGLKTSALCMQRTSEAITYIHGREGFYSRPYLDDFGGAEKTAALAGRALHTLQRVMRELGVVEAEHKICEPAQVMIWLGILFDSKTMKISIPPDKLREIMDMVATWEGRRRATQRELQSLMGSLQFVASVSPTTRIFTNRILQCLREAPQRGAETLSLGFRKDVKFFLDLLPQYNGVRVLRKEDIGGQESLELDACLTGCGACTDDQYYSEQFPQEVLDQQHTIAHLEFLNVTIAVKVWGTRWAGQRVRVACDNSNTCLALQTGRSRDPFIQHCIREIFLVSTRQDIEVRIEHRPGVQLVRADALSRAHTGQNYRDWIARDPTLAAATRVRVPVGYFQLTSDL